MTLQQTCNRDEHAASEPALPVSTFAGAASLFRALGDPARLQLLQLLRSGEACVSDLVTRLNEKFPTVSQRLRLLRSEGLVSRRRAGNHIYYALADRHVADLIDNALAHAAELATPGKNRHSGQEEIR